MRLSQAIPGQGERKKKNESDLLLQRWFMIIPDFSKIAVLGILQTIETWKTA